MMKIVLLTSSLVGAFGADCAKGYKHKATFAATDVCSTKGTSSSVCNTGCCVKDVLKCGGQTTALMATCATGFYWGADGDKATTTATAKTDCCVAVATCATSMVPKDWCPAGYKYNSANKDTKCTGGISSCTAIAGTCCMKDVLKCGGLDVTCASGKVPNNGRRRTTTDAWRNKATKESTKLTDCCMDKATCAFAGTCSAGYVKDTAKTSSTTITGQDNYYSTAGYTSTSTNGCCKLDVTKCAAYSATAGCDATHYNVATENPGKAATATSKKTDCCAVKAKCSAHTCGAGKKKNTVTDCTMGTTSCEGACCVKDPLKCGGIASIVCPTATSYKEFNTRPSTAGATQTAWDAWANQATTEADKNKCSCTAKGCCTAKGTCTAFKAAVSASALVSKTAAQMLPGALLIVVLSALVAF